MTAIREGQIEMAEFLLDNGVGHSFITKMVVSLIILMSSVMCTSTLF